DTSDPIHAREKLPEAAQLLNEAVMRDPHFLHACCLLSRVHSVAYFRCHYDTQSRLDFANSFFQSALYLQPDAGEVHLSLANYDRAPTIVPADPITRILRAKVALDWRADIKPFQTTLATLVAENPNVATDVDLPLYALCERTAAAATRTLTNYPREGVANNGV